MMKSEFIALTGFEPTEEEYQAIEADYYRFNGDKQVFCRKFVSDGKLAAYANARRNNLAKTVRLLKGKVSSQAMEIKSLENRILKMQRSLDLELGWMLCDSAGTNMSDEDYQKLLHCGDTRVLSYTDALDLIHDDFGFDPDKVTLIKTVHTYEVNKYRQLRKRDEYLREALYNASDWNYIRFDCAGFRWEMINGGLQPYNC